MSCAGLLGMAYYFEYVMFLDPCPLCMLQRLITLMIGVGFLLAFFTRKTGTPLKAALLFTIAWGIFGIWAADHQLWLQGLPPEDVPACGPSFDYMLDTMPLADLLKVMLHGDGNCAEVSWTMMGKSMPWWTRVAFAVYTLAAVFALFRSSRKNNA
ncbi:MAG: disulfide bond formation protein B [Oleibacter sp.]|nr:disulfide bond formation protein B [Thalassolituus sp.]